MYITYTHTHTHTHPTYIHIQYFVPKSQVVNWVNAARPIYSRALTSHVLTLLNTTIRMVQQDRYIYVCERGGCPAGERGGVYV